MLEKVVFFLIAVAGLGFVIMAGTAIDKTLDFPFPLASAMGGMFVSFVMTQLWSRYKESGRR